MSYYAISDEGEDLNRLILQWIPDSVKPEKRRQGDVKWKERLIECKDKSMNQVRPLLYIPIVFRKNGKMYIISANQIVRLSKDKNRGQHSELAIENCNLSSGDSLIKKYELKNQTPIGLQKAILKAFKEADKDMETKNFCLEFNNIFLPKVREMYQTLKKKYNL
jgi:hypothetical protein